MSEEKKHKQAIDFGHLGRKVGHPKPVRTEKEISFESIGGKVVRRSSDHPEFNTKPEESDDQ